MRTEPLQLAGGAYTDESRPFSIQDTLNMRAQRTEAGGTRAPDKLQTLPGLRPFVEAGDGIVRGTHNAEGRLLAVIGGTLYRITGSGVAVPIGSVPGSGRVMIDHNQISLGNEVMLVNGSAGYLWNTVTDAFGRITDPGFPGGAVVKFIDSYFVVIEPQGRFAQSSSPAQGLEWNTLDRFTSEVSPDRLMAAGVRGSELLLLSASSGEFFQATSNTRQPFRTKRIDFKVGAPGPYVVAEGDNNIWWLGSDGVFYCLNGYSQARISTRPIENAIKGLDWSKAFAFRWDTVIYWTFPDGRTWGYDYAEREWHRRESYGLNRWRANSMTFWNRRWIAGDFQTGRLWDCNLEDRYYLEGDTPFVVRRTVGVSHDNQNPVRCPRLELVMDTGQPLTEAVSFPAQPDGPTISGDPGDAVAGAQFTFAYTLANGTQPYTVSLRSGALPDGLSLSAAGVISGTPTVVGTFTWVARVTDANGLWDEITSESVVTDSLWLYGPVNENGALGGSTAFYMKALDPTHWEAATPIPLPNGMTDLGRISVANGVVFFHAPSSTENAQVSTDGGTTWQEADHPLFVDSVDTRDVYWNGNFYYFHGVRSADGLAWTAIPNLPAVTIRSWIARESDGLFLISATNTNIYTTLDDGATAFTTRVNPFSGIPQGAFTTNGTRISGSGGIGYGYSDDAFATAAIASATGPGSSLTYANGAWIGQRFELMRSTDGATYSQVQAIDNTSVNERQCDFGNDLWAWADKVGPAETLFYTSADNGVTWTAGETVYGPGGYVAFVRPNL